MIFPTHGIQLSSRYPMRYPMRYLACVPLPAYLPPFLGLPASASRNRELVLRIASRRASNSRRGLPCTTSLPVPHLLVSSARHACRIRQSQRGMMTSRRLSALNSPAETSSMGQVAGTRPVVPARDDRTAPTVGKIAWRNIARRFVPVNRPVTYRAERFDERSAGQG